MHDRKPKCRNHDWLDWTRDNIYVPVTTRTEKTVAESEQSRFEWMSRPGQISDVAPAGMDNSPLEIIDARLRGSEKVGELVQPYVDPVFAETQANRQIREDEGVVWAFKNASKMPNIPSENSREGTYDHFENALKGCSVREDDGPNRSLWAEERPATERPDRATRTA